MSKRSRRKSNDAKLANTPASETAPEALPADHSHVEPTLVVSGDAFQQFDAAMDAQLEELVGRWIHTAAPAASAIRRVVAQPSQL
jgi:hypothetical protein